MSTKKYWSSIAQLEDDPQFLEQAQNEFAEPVPVDEFLNSDAVESGSTSRRDFLKFLGFSLTAASLAACETPVVKSVPYVSKPEEVHPGVPNFYASTFADGTDFASIVVKTREGRPIHIEGNKLAGAHGGINARINASILSLYDSSRDQSPSMGGNAASWTEVDKAIGEKLSAIASKGGKIRILSESIASPSTNSAIQHFVDVLGGKQMGAGHPAVGDNTGSTDGAAADSTAAAAPTMGGGNYSADVKHVAYDAVSYSGILSANKQQFGTAAIPAYDFTKADVIVSIDADFLVNWGMATAYAPQYGVRRNPDHAHGMSEHFQFETGLTVTGAKADTRRAIKPSEVAAVAAMLYNKVAGASVKAGAVEDSEHNNVTAGVEAAAKALKGAMGKSIVVCGSNDPNVQLLVNGINEALNNYGSTMDMDAPVMIKQGIDSEVKALIAEMKSGSVDAILIHGVNPAYSMPKAWGFTEALAKVGTKISFADRKTEETAALCDFVCPDNHYLESWGDCEPVKGHYTLQQPVIRQLFDTRQWQSSLLNWAGLDSDYRSFMMMHWEHAVFPMQNEQSSFRIFWNKALKDGLFAGAASGGGSATHTPGLAERIENTLEDAVEEVVDAIAGGEEAVAASGGSVDYAAAASAAAKSGGAWEMFIYQKVAAGDGSAANNPWLAELPDPISRMVWDHYITMHPADMKELGMEVNIQQETPATVAEFTVDGETLALPVVAIPGQRKKTIGMALGYGRAEGIGRTAKELGGINAFAFVNGGAANRDYHVYEVGAPAAKEAQKVASTQTHHTVMGRKIVNETSLHTYQTVDKDDNKKGWNPTITLADAYGEHKTTEEINLWDDHPIKRGHRWGMTIDLNTCIGCGTCVTACGSENNVPVVGRDEVRRNREMFWMQIHRYYSSDADIDPLGISTPYDSEGNPAPQDYGKMEVPSDYPQVSFQPMLCQHCNHAPCETVCPVAATTHSHEGWNQMAYNRCVGTRYCANNCPYKVRRFNWFNYTAYHKFTETNPSQDSLARMVLNPDVTVRTRGVMEKCSMCVQRIQAGKLQAKKDGTPVQDGSIQTACSASCPTNAITFGDVNDEKSMVAANSKHDRAYHLIEEVGTQPNIWYMTLVRNAEERDLPRGRTAVPHGGHGDHGAHGEEHDAHATEETHTEAH